MRVASDNFSSNNFIKIKNSQDKTYSNPVNKNVSFGLNPNVKSLTQKLLGDAFQTKSSFIETENQIVSTNMFPFYRIDCADFYVKDVKDMIGNVLASLDNLPIFVDAAKEFKAVNKVLHIGYGTPTKYNAVSGEIESHAVATLSADKTIYKNNISPKIIKKLEARFAKNADVLHFNRKNQIITLKAKRGDNFQGQNALVGIDLSVEPKK